MSDIHENLLYGPNELEKWLDSSPPLSDDDIKSMSAYFDSEHSHEYKNFTKIERI